MSKRDRQPERQPDPPCSIGTMLPQPMLPQKRTAAPMHVDATPKRMPSKVKEEHLPEEHLCSAEAHFYKGLRQFQLLHDEHGNPQKDKFRLGKEQVLEGMLRLGEVFGSNDRWNQVEAWTFQNFQTVRKHNISPGCPDIVLVFVAIFR